MPLNTTTGTFSEDTKAQLIFTLSRFGCREIPTPASIYIQSLLKQAAACHVVHKPLAAVSIIHSGIPEKHKAFWIVLSIQNFHKMYVALSANPLKVLHMIKEPTCLNSSQECEYLNQFVGNLNGVRRFMRFVTGVLQYICSTDKIEIIFSAGRYPISHTCDSTLELPTTYATYTLRLLVISNISSLTMNTVG